MQSYFTVAIYAKLFFDMFYQWFLTNQDANIFTGLVPFCKSGHIYMCMHMLA